MSRKTTTMVLLSSLAAALLSVAVLVHADSPFSIRRREINEKKTLSVDRNVRDETNERNLKLQPEAIKLLRRVGGARFRLKTPPALVMNGVLTIGSERQDIQFSRSQRPRGERVELVFANGKKVASWEASAGARGSNGKLEVTDRVVLERLIFDSADEFILAQIRGASYQVVVSNLRPDNAPDDYAGPLWDVIRIDDPEADEQKRPLSRWRLYHLNRTTGLIDKIVSESEGERIEANLSDWKETDGEKFPSTIIWTRGGQPLMTLNVTNVSFVAQ